MNEGKWSTRIHGHALDGYDVFLSYRAEDQVVRRLHSRLQNLKVFEEIGGRLESRNLRVFWDPADVRSVCEWDQRTIVSAKALCTSAVVVLVMSLDTFDASTLARLKDMQMDHALLEHDVALELWDNARVQRIVPLYVGESKREYNDLPNVVVEPIKRQAIHILHEAGLCNLPPCHLTKLSEVPSLSHGRTAKQTLEVVSKAFDSFAIQDTEESVDDVAGHIYHAVEEQAHLVSRKQVYERCKQQIFECLASPNIIGTHGSPICTSEGPNVEDGNFDHEVWVTYTVGDVPTFREVLRGWLNGFMSSGKPAPTWTFCHLVLLSFLRDPKTKLVEGEMAVTALWKRWCTESEDQVKFVTMFDSYVKCGWIKSTRFQGWGCRPMQDHPEHLPPSLTVIKHLVPELLRKDTASQRRWQGVVEHWQQAPPTDHTKGDALNSAEEFLAEVLAQQRSAIAGLRGILKNGCHTVFLQLPNLLGCLWWQWLASEPTILDRQSATGARAGLRAPPTSFLRQGRHGYGIRLLASSRGTIMPGSHHWDAQVVANVVATLRRIAALPNYMLHADGPLSIVEDENFPIFQGTPARRYGCGCEALGQGCWVWRCG